MHPFAKYFHFVMSSCRFTRRALTFVLLNCTIVYGATVPTTANLYRIDLQRQPMVSALSQLSEIAGFDWWSFDTEYMKGETAEPLNGYFTARQAVAELFKNTGIQYKWTDSGNLHIIGKSIVTQPLPKKVVEPAARTIEEVTVVGSHIRGTNPAAPVFRFDREAIQQSGLKTIQGFINRLPQVFGGGASEGVISNIKGEGARLNIADASGINMLGMGFDSTLVLLNGRRLAPVGFGDVVDISAIPLDAIEHIDVMMDGASAIYGSDAVGGVVNIILRNRYEGIETRVGYGDVTHGDNESYWLSHTVGKHWSSGNALLSYNYRQRANLNTKDRSSTQNVATPADILGEHTQHDTVFSVSQQLTERTDLFVDMLHSTRETEQNKATFSGNIVDSRSVRHTSLAAGAGIDLTDSWRMDSNLLYSGSSTVSDLSGAVSSSRKTALDTWVLETKVDGETFEAWGGNAKLALGGQYRREAFNVELENTATPGKEKSDRDITAAFAELLIPLVSKDNYLPAVERLELTLAGRHERYSDFGSSTSPKAGLLWSPVSGLTLRTTYSNSFRAPLLFEQSRLVIGQFSVVEPLPDLSALEGVTSSLFIHGYKEGLQPEKAINWTFGADITPVAWSGFKVSFTYFSIKVTDRLQVAFEGAELNNALIDPSFAPVVIRNPDMDLINFWTSQPNFINSNNVPLSDIGAVVDNRLHNIAALRERGLDFSLEYSLNTNIGEFAFRLGGTYVLALESLATGTAPFVDILNTPYNPVDLKLHNYVTWKRNGLTATVFANYVGSYKDTRPGQERDIDAWTTVDLTIDYNIKQSAGSWLDGAGVSLSVSNLFDQKPPFVADALGYNFDAANANAIGRHISLEFTKKW